MDTEGMQPHPIFDALDLLNDEVLRAYKESGLHEELNMAFARRHQPRTVGWDHAFADMEEDNDREQAFAVNLGFQNASDYHAETDWCDRTDMMAYREDLEP
jgi:hypothetical protein